jgi:hypothetical protein
VHGEQQTGDQEPPHDILAAEAFALPAADPQLHRAPLALPEDLTGTTEPRDVLAAEEFAIPAPAGESGSPSRGGGDRMRGPLAALGSLAVLAVFRRRARQRRR